MEESVKPWWSSKMLWTNGIALVASVSGAFSVDLGLDPETQAKLVIGIMAFVNIILRLVTKAAVR